MKETPEQGKLYDVGTLLRDRLEMYQSEDGRKELRREYQEYMAVDCSEKNLQEVAYHKFGSKPYENEWKVYSFLKGYCGISSVHFSEEEYKKRMDVICKVAGV